MPPTRKKAGAKKDGLSASDRKQNHVAAEKKRREAIRKEFERITEVVPELSRNQSRSEAVVLEKTVALLKNLVDENQKLKELARANKVALRSD